MKSKNDIIDEIESALQNGNKIEAIKILRESSDLGLKEAKEMIDNKGSHIPHEIFNTKEDPPDLSSYETRDHRDHGDFRDHRDHGDFRDHRDKKIKQKEVLKTIEFALQEGNQIEAIRILRHASGLSLREAKGLIYEKGSRISPELINNFDPIPEASGCISKAALVLLGFGLIYKLLF